jgi:HEPN domain-containing protein/predicted nucleotidyltransferase
LNKVDAVLRTLKDISGRLIKYYDPERIILFGSYDEKSLRNGSDIDLIVIKQTDKRLIERQMEVERIICDRLLPLDIIVYTSEEVRFLYSIGSPFIEEVMEKGRVLYMRKMTMTWMKDAQEELDSAVILHEHKKYRSACYHSEQCVEKGLKAVIPERGKRPERTDDIVELVNKVLSFGFDSGLSIDDAVFLNSIYKGRYPTEQGLLPHGDPTHQDTAKAISIAKTFMERFKSQMK